MLLVFIAGAIVVLIGTAIIQNKRSTADVSQGSPRGSIRIGLMLPLTGDGASYGITEQRAASLAQGEINAKGGIDGKTLEYVTEDSKCDPAGGAAAAQKLVNVDNVKIIFGGACSGETLAALPITDEAKVLMLSPSATNPSLSKNDYFFRTISSDAGQGAVGARYAFQTLGARNVAIISEQTDYAQGLSKVFKDNFKQLGGQIVTNEVYQTADTDLRAQVLKIKQTSPDVIYIVPQSPTKGELIVKQLKAQEVSAKFLSTEVFLDRDMLAKNPSLFGGIYATEPYFDQEAGAAKTFLTKFKEKYNESPTYPSYAANMYSQAYLIKEGTEKVGTDTAKLKDWLSKIRNWKHALGELSFNADGDAVSPYVVRQIQSDGSLTQIEIMR